MTLINSVYIERIFNSVEADIGRWEYAWTVQDATISKLNNSDKWQVISERAYRIADEIVSERFPDVKIQLWDRIQQTVNKSKAWLVVNDAVTALVAYDHAGDILKMPPNEVLTMCWMEYPAAVLLYPAILALADENLTING